MSTLVIGGTSGLGLELARDFSKSDKAVIITGRKDPYVDFAEFHEFYLHQLDLPAKIEAFVAKLPRIDKLVYAAGYFQEGRVTDLSNEQIEEMIDVCGRALVYFVRALLQKQDSLDELVTITSTSQWTPRKLEPVYNFAKAAAGHFTNAIAEDGRIKKTMVAGPAGMDTNFWKGTDQDTSTMNDPAWVAGQIMKCREQDYRYKFIRILREPPRIEEVEQR